MNRAGVDRRHDGCSIFQLLYSLHLGLEDLADGLRNSRSKKQASGATLKAAAKETDGAMLKTTEALEEGLNRALLPAAEGKDRQYTSRVLEGACAGDAGLATPA